MALSRRFALNSRRVHSISNFLSLLAVRVVRDERQEIVQGHGEITPGAALCIVVECAAVVSGAGLFGRRPREINCLAFVLAGGYG